MRKDNGWVVRERGDYPADFKAISDLIIKLTDLKVVQSEHDRRIAAAAGRAGRARAKAKAPARRSSSRTPQARRSRTSCSARKC